MKSVMNYYYEHRKWYCIWVCAENLNIKSRNFQLIQNSLSSTWSALTTLDLEHYAIHFFLLMATIEITTWHDNPTIKIKTQIAIIFLFQVFAPEYVSRTGTKFFTSQLGISFYCMYLWKYTVFSIRSKKAKIENCIFVFLWTLGASNFR